MAMITIAGTHARAAPADFAALGGTPRFSRPLVVGAPNVGRKRRFLARVRTILRSGRLSNDGPFVREFEARVADALQVAHCIATCNATIAMSLLLRALDLSGEVIVPSFTFVATAHAVRWHGLEPVFCDIDPASHNLDPEDAVRAVTPRTRAICGVHLWGRPCAVERLTALARAHNLHIFFDAAHAFGCSKHGRLIGGFGEAEVFSFHATKQVNAFEGGAITTNDAALAAALRRLRAFGVESGAVEGIGINAKMSEVSAAMAITNLESVHDFRAASCQNYRRYRHGLEGIPGVRVCHYDERELCNYHYVVIEVDRAVTGLSRDDLLTVLAAEKVVARRYFAPGCHRVEPYRSTRAAARPLPATERLCDRVLVLPNGVHLGADSIDAVCELIAAAVACGPALTTRLRAHAHAAAS
jgi:dTDP-4-amino-4,6-dideoxygalactose transaminase